MGNRLSRRVGGATMTFSEPQAVPGASDQTLTEADEEESSAS